jgi:hypothetical protein
MTRPLTGNGGGAWLCCWLYLTPHAAVSTLAKPATGDVLALALGCTTGEVDMGPYVFGLYEG